MTKVVRGPQARVGPHRPACPNGCATHLSRLGHGLSDRLECIQEGLEFRLGLALQ